MRMTVRITDKGVGQAAKSIFGRQHASVTVGVFGEKGNEPVEDSSISMADLAAIHEFGAGAIPERSFVRSYFDAHEKEISEMLMRLMRQEMIRAVRTGKPISDGDKRRILEKIGLFMVAGMQSRISAGEITPQLAETEAGRRTIARKGSSVTLIDTGQLRSSITHETEIK